MNQLISESVMQFIINPRRNNNIYYKEIICIAQIYIFNDVISEYVYTGNPYTRIVNKRTK